jgi:NitT/TauT family transport system substrate-binding protein
MISRRKFIAAVPALGLVASSGTRAWAQTTEIKIGSLLSTPNIAADMLPGILAKEGIKAEVINFPNITQRMQAIASGDIQFGYGGISAAILLAALDVKLAVISNAAEGGWNMLAAQSINKWDDLRSKKIAVQIGTPADLTLRWKLKQVGLSDAVELVNMQSSDMPTAMSRGDITAVMLFEPYGAFILTKGWAKQFWRPYESPMHRVNLGVIGSPAFMEKNRPLIRTVMKAHQEATSILMKDKTTAANVVVKSMNMPMDVAVACLDNTFFSIDSGPKFKSDIIALGGMMKDAGLIKRYPDWDKFVDTSYLS